MKRLFAGMLIIGILIGGCTKKSTMTSTDANDIAENFVATLQYQGVNMVNPAGMTPLVKGDSTIVTGDLTDNDGDGVTVSGRYEIHNNDTFSFDTLQTIMIMDGVIQHDDATTDDDPYTWHVTVNNPTRTDNNFVFSFSSNSSNMEMLYHGDMSASKSGNTYTVSLNDFAMHITINDTLSASLTYDWTVTFTPDDATWHPGDTSTSGNFTIDGTYGFSNEKSYSLTVETITPLHITPGYTTYTTTIDSGKIKLTDSNGNEIVITFGAGGTYTVELNGTPVS